ncbi:hypothetical protein Ciccas_011456 [Cichlidogyrus casuarinus]|uniref:alkaline phosphatase n=1 Tax=Cichlidogyrus casuarinus TaxID=1844966 RepID=A0ABD2PRU4_9PLAT
MCSALFSQRQMPFDYELPKDASQKMGIKEMVEFAVEYMERRSRATNKRYVLFLEGGLIDFASHMNQPQIVADQTIAFDEAVAAARRLTNDQETLVIVTTDHSHGLIIANGKRDNSIHGLFGYTPAKDYHVEFMNVGYLTGPGKNVSVPTAQQAATIINDITYTYPSLYYAKYAYHAGEDVLIAAHGPMARFVTGNHDNTYIAYLIEYLLGIAKISKSLPSLSSNHTFAPWLSGILFIFIIASNIFLY